MARRVQDGLFPEETPSGEGWEASAHFRPLAELVREANRAVYERSMTDRAVSGMGTTLTAAAPGDILRYVFFHSLALACREALNNDQTLRCLGHLGSRARAG